MLHRRHTAPALALLAIACAPLLAACVEYDAPTEVTLDQPADGIYRVGDTLTLRFSQAIDAATLGIRVWPGERDIEGALLAYDPSQAVCTPGASECGTTTLVVAPDRLTATVDLDPEGLGQADVPLSLEVVPGLVGATGADRVAAAFFDFQFKPSDEDLDPTEPFEFQSGAYMIVATVEQPLPTVISIMGDFLVTEDGRLAMAGAEADEIGEAPRNTKNPEELQIDASEQGFTVYATGNVRGADGETFVTTDPFDITITIGPITILLEGVRMNGIMEPLEGSEHDSIAGTLSYQRVVLSGALSHEYEAGSVSFCANYIPPELVPEGTPEVCGDLCGAVVEGTCMPAGDFPSNGVCDPDEEPEGGESEGGAE